MLINLPITYDLCVDVPILRPLNARLAKCLNSVLNVTAIVGVLNQRGLLRDCLKPMDRLQL